MESKSAGSGFYKHVIVSSLVVFLLVVYPVSRFASIVQLYSLVCGYLIGLLNAVAGYNLNSLAFEKNTKSFMVLVFGGMGLRMILIAIFILILLYIVKLDEISLVSSVFFFYVLFVIIELVHLNKRQHINKTTLDSSKI